MRTGSYITAIAITSLSTIGAFVVTVNHQRPHQHQHCRHTNSRSSSWASRDHRKRPDTSTIHHYYDDVTRFDELQELELVQSSLVPAIINITNSDRLGKNQSLQEIQVLEESEEVLDEDIIRTKRRQKELDLLVSLSNSDKSVDDILDLWRSEGGDGKVSYNANDEEEIRRVIMEHPEWADPRVHLAILLLEQHRIIESYEVALQALELKPWHFAVPQIFVLLSLHEGLFGQALHWARLRIPQLRMTGSNGRSPRGIRKRGSRRRAVWAHRALEEACRIWGDGDAEIYGPEADEENEYGRRPRSVNEGGVWQ